MGSRAAKAKSVDATAKNDPFYNFTVTEAKFEEYKRRAMKGFWRHAITGFIMISVVEYYLYKNAYPYLVKKTINKDLVKILKEDEEHGKRIEKRARLLKEALQLAGNHNILQQENQNYSQAGV